MYLLAQAYNVYYVHSDLNYHSYACFYSLYNIRIIVHSYALDIHVNTSPPTIFLRYIVYNYADSTNFRLKYLDVSHSITIHADSDMVYSSSIGYAKLSKFYHSNQHPHVLHKCTAYKYIM